MALSDREGFCCGEGQGSHLSRKTLKLMLDFMGQVFKDAIEDGFMQTETTASRKLVIPSNKKTEREAIFMEEFRKSVARVSISHCKMDMICS